MTTIDDYELNDRYLAIEGTVFLTGIQALARLPLDQLRADRAAGLNTAAFVSGYQGSPLGGYGDSVVRVAKLAPELPLVFRAGMNEEYAASAVMGSQLATVQPDCRYDGVIGIWYGKAPGVDRAADALRHGVYTGTSMRGGVVAIVGDDPAAKSSTIPSSSAGLLFDMHMPIFYPGDPAEALSLGRHAIAMSRASGLWVAMKIVADVADATASVDLRADEFSPVIPLVDGLPYQHWPDGRLLTPHTLELEREIVEVRYELARRYAADNRVNHTTANPADAWIGIVASGITYREVMEAFARLGLTSERDIEACGIRLLKMGMPMPFNASLMREFAGGLREILVVEEKSPNVESLLKDALYDLAVRPLIVGKVDEVGAELAPAYGSLDADDIVPILRRRLGATLGDRLVPMRALRQKISVTAVGAQRTPFYCSGCPHNRSTQAPDGALVGAGIGCHTMALLMDPERVGDIAGITCMGNEGTQWIGMAPFLERDHFIQNLGDGTYFHSGQLAIGAAVAAGVNITYKLLYNGTVAMTGGQDPEGKLDVRAVTRTLLDRGVARVLITADDPARYRHIELPTGVDVWHRTRLMEAQETLAKWPGVTVLIHDQACAAEARRDRKRGLIPTPNRRVVINSRICEGCGDCGQVSNCLSVQPVETPFGPKTTIDQTTCNLDYSCLEGDCPSFVTVALTDNEKREPRVAPQAPTDLPDPVLVVPADDFAMRITGIGGTGVVTVAQVIGTAGMLDGYHVRGLDQIGLSQKAGPVVSDVRLSYAKPTPTNRLGEGQADLLLAFDQLVAASDKGLLTADPARTAAVGSTSTTPTGSMITHLDERYPTESSLRARIAECTRADSQHWADAERVTTELLGEGAAANLFVVGMAVQAGCLPVTPASIERSIELNGVAVAANLAAFRWGRAHVARPEVVEAARHIAMVRAEPRPRVLGARLAARVAAADQRGDLTLFALELSSWQNEATAHAWLDVVERAAAAERGAGGDGSFAAAVAANLYKLMAYKDEYEVARLMTDAAAMNEARAIAGRAGRVAWQLHPPLLRAMGLKRKIAIPMWAAPGVRLLAAGKVLRGSVFDPFRWAAVRRVERALPGEYIATIDRLIESLSAARLAGATELAALPDMVRGYEHIKLANVDRYRVALASKLADVAR